MVKSSRRFGGYIVAATALLVCGGGLALRADATEAIADRADRQEAATAQHAFGFAVGEERRYALEDPERVARRRRERPDDPRHPLWIINLERIEPGEERMAFFRLRYAGPEVLTSDTVEARIAVNRAGFPVAIDYERDEFPDARLWYENGLFEFDKPATMMMPRFTIETADFTRIAIDFSGPSGVWIYEFWGRFEPHVGTPWGSRGYITGPPVFSNPGLISILLSALGTGVEGKTQLVLLRPNGVAMRLREARSRSNDDREADRPQWLWERSRSFHFLATELEVLQAAGTPLSGAAASGRARLGGNEVHFDADGVIARMEIGRDVWVRRLRPSEY